MLAFLAGVVGGLILVLLVFSALSGGYRFRTHDYVRPGTIAYEILGRVYGYSSGTHQAGRWGWFLTERRFRYGPTVHAFYRLGIWWRVPLIVSFRALLTIEDMHKLGTLTGAHK